ncbi:MAG: HEAT repeat domain-containing protein, partial [Gammaproteobacteria bacterium]
AGGGHGGCTEPTVFRPLMLKRWLWLGCLALLVMLPAAIWLLKPSRDAPPVVPPITAVPQVNAPPLELMWRAGTSQRYQVQTDSAMQMNSAGVGTGQALRVKMNCALEMMTLEADTEEAVVGMRLASVDLQIGGQSDGETNRALTTPFRVRFNVTGMPKAFEFPVGVSAQNRSILENLVRMFQVTMGKGKTWVAQETNASGSYEATYQRTNSTQVEMIKRKFTALPSVPMLARAVISSTEAFRLDPQHDWLASMTVDETLRNKGQGGPGIEIINHGTLELRPIAHAAVSDAAWRFVASTAPAVTKSMDPQVMNISKDEAQDKIRDAVTQLDATKQGRIKWIHRLRDLLRVDGSLPAALLDLMRNQPLSDRTRADLYLALQLAGTGAAQGALRSVIEDTSWSTRDAKRAIVALSGVDKPKPESLTTLWDAVENAPMSGDRHDIVSTATYALGNIGRTMREAKDPDYTELRGRLLNGALSGSGVEQRANFTFAVGNTRDPSLAREIVPLLDDPQPAIRRAAALSLGMLDTDAVAGDLMSHIRQESSSTVRDALAESLVNWTTPSASAMASIRSMVRSDPDENTRYNMARILSANLMKFPENRQVLQDLLRTEQSKRIRQSVANALAESDQSGASN